MKRFRMVLVLACLVALMGSVDAFAVVNISGIANNNGGALLGRGWTVHDLKWGNGVALPGTGLYTGALPGANTGTTFYDAIASQAWQLVTPPMAPPSGTHQKALFSNIDILLAGATGTNTKMSLNYNDWSSSGTVTAWASAMKPTDPNDSSTGTFSLDYYHMVQNQQYAHVSAIAVKMVFYRTGIGSRYVIFEPAYRSTGWNNVEPNIWYHETSSWTVGNWWVNVDGSHYVSLKTLYDNNYGNFKDVVDNNWAMVHFQLGQGTGPGCLGWLNQISSSMLMGGELVTFGQDLLAGDANGDGYVDISDLAILSANWGDGGKVWATGDFTGDGNVDISDLAIMSANWTGSGSGAAVSTGAVPLPSAFGAGLALLGLGLSRRRR